MAEMNSYDKGVQIRRDIMQYITEYILERGYSPSIRQIGEGVGLKSTSSVQTHIKKLIIEGKLESDSEFGQPRAIRVPGLIKKENYWISVNDRLPESDLENPVTKDWYKYPCIHQCGDVIDIRFYSFGDGHWYNGPQQVDSYVTYWFELPKAPQV